MIHLILGRQGSGKTLLMVKVAYAMMKKGRKIYSNVHFNFPYDKLNYRDIVDCKLKKACVFIDEIHLLLSARLFMKRTSIKICDSFLSMARKQETEIYGTTQTARKVDVRFREEADYIYYCSKYAYDGNKWVEVLHNFNLDATIPIMIHIEVEETFSGNFSRLFFKGNDYYSLYDTMQVVKVEGLPEK